MKKTSIYILSLIVIVIVALSVVLPGVEMLRTGVESFSVGFDAGMEGKDKLSLGTPIDVNFDAETSKLIQPTDSIVFDNGAKLPIVIGRVSVILPEAKIPAWFNWAIGLSYPLQIVMLLLLIWKFIRFLINISKEKIFVSSNVKILRQLAVIFMAIALLEIVAGVANEMLLVSHPFAMQGYAISANWAFPWTNLLLGCLSLLFAQVWARGLEIREDQDLTI